MDHHTLNNSILLLPPKGFKGGRLFKISIFWRKEERSSLGQRSREVKTKKYDDDDDDDNDDEDDNNDDEEEEEVVV